MRTAINLWHNPSYCGSKATLSYEGKCLLRYRGVEVYKNPAGSWDYLLGNAGITQRAGFDKDYGRKIIDGILSENRESMDYALCSKEVKAHISAFKQDYPVETAIPDASAVSV